MRILVAALCWAPAASVIPLAAFVSYFKAGSSVAIPKNIAPGTRWWLSRQRLQGHEQGGLLGRLWIQGCSTAPEVPLGAGQD